MARTTRGCAPLLENTKSLVAAFGGAAVRLFGGVPVRASTGSSLFRTGQQQNRRTTDALLEAYSERPYLAGPADMVSTDVGCIQFKLFAVTGPGSGERYVRPVSVQRAQSPRLRRKALDQLRDADRLVEIEEHPFLDLIYAPNPEMTGADYLKLTQLYLDLVGDAPTLMVMQEARLLAGQPRELWPVPITWLKRQGGRLFLDPPFMAMRTEVAPENVLLLKDFDPHNPYGRGLGTARTLSDELDIAEYAAKEIKSRLYNGTLPDFIATLKESNPEEARRFKAALRAGHQGPNKRGNFEVTNKEFKIEKLSQTLADWQAKDLLPMQRDAIRMRFGVPPEILGDVKDSNRATITAALTIYMSRVIEPRMERIRQALQAKILPLYDERLVLDFVSPVPDDSDFTLDAMKAFPHHVTRDEARGLMGLPPADQSGDEFFGSPLVQPMSTERSSQGRTKVLKLHRAEEKGRFTDEDASDVFWQAIQRVADRLEPKVRARFLGAVEAMLDEAEENAAEILAAIRTGRPDVIVDALPWATLSARFAGAGDELRGLMLAAMEGAGSLAAQEAGTMLGIEISFTIENERAIRAAAERAATLVREVTERSRDAIRGVVADAIREGRTADREMFRLVRDRIGLTESQTATLGRFEARLIEEGASPEQIARRVERQHAAMLRRRAQTIARTETIWSANAGEQELIQQTIEQGIAGRENIRKTWITTPDERLCPICEPMPFLDDNLNVGPDGVFTTGEGGTVLHPPAHTACRCGMGWEIEDASSIDPDRSIRLGAFSAAVAKLASKQEVA